MIPKIKDHCETPSSIASPGGGECLRSSLSGIINKRFRVGVNEKKPKRDKKQP